MTNENQTMDIATQRILGRIQHELRDSLAPYIGTERREIQVPVIYTPNQPLDSISVEVNLGDIDRDEEEHIPVLSIRDGQVYVDDVNVASMPEEVTESETRDLPTHSRSNRRHAYNTAEEVIEHLSQYNGLEVTGIIEDMGEGVERTVTFNGNDVAMTVNGMPMGTVQPIGADLARTAEPGEPLPTIDTTLSPLGNLTMDTEGIRVASGRIASGQISASDLRVPYMGTVGRTYTPPKRYQIDPEKIQNTTDMIRVFRAMLDEMNFSQEIVDKFELQDLATEIQSPSRTNISGGIIRSGSLQAESLRTADLRINDDADAQRIAQTMINTINGTERTVTF